MCRSGLTEAGLPAQSTAAIQSALQETRGWVTTAPAEQHPGTHTPLGGREHLDHCAALCTFSFTYRMSLFGLKDKSGYILYFSYCQQIPTTVSCKHLLCYIFFLCAIELHCYIKTHIKWINLPLRDADGKSESIERWTNAMLALVFAWQLLTE